jgi:hypothetical protein
LAFNIVNSSFDENEQLKSPVPISVPGEVMEEISYTTLATRNWSGPKKVKTVKII